MMKLSIDMGAVNRAKANAPSYHDLATNFETVPVTIVFPDGEELVLSFLMGETLREIKHKVFDEKQLWGQDFKMYLGFVSQATYMMDPLSLNDFPAVCELASSKQSIRIAVVFN